MNVGIGAVPLFHGHRAIHRYVLHLVRELVELEGDESYRLFAYRFRGGTHPLIPPHAPPRLHHCWTRIPGRVLAALWDRLEAPGVDLFTGALDVYHATDFDTPPLRRGKLVFTLHGVAYLARPDLLPPAFVESSRRHLERAVRRSELFVAVSETTRQQLLEHYPRTEGRVRVVPLGVSPEFFAPDGSGDAEVLARHGVSRPYVLFVGATTRLKNVPALLRGFEMARGRLDGGLRLVLAGPPPPPEEPEVAEEVRRACSGGSILALGMVGGDLPALYRNAEAFVFPSLSEGWTSPPLEAMACGTPVVASAASSVPETVGDAAITVPPSPEALAEGLERVLTDEGLRRDLVIRGRERAARFTWERTARATLAVYREVGG